MSENWEYHRRYIGLPHKVCYRLELNDMEWEKEYRYVIRKVRNRLYCGDFIVMRARHFNMIIALRNEI